jgi:hypothetical protein
MRRWEIFEAEIPPGQKHPVVILSPQSICDASGIGWVNVLLCSSIKEGELLGGSEVGLDIADGLPKFTGCQCHMLWHVKKAKLLTKMGEVTFERRAHIKKKFRDALEL